MSLFDIYPRENRQPRRNDAALGVRRDREEEEAQEGAFQRSSNCGCGGYEHDCRNDCCCCYVGPMGPSGFRDATGTTGATDPTGPASAQLGVHAQLRSGTTLGIGSAVAFDTMANDQSLDISYMLGSGNFVIARPGNYQVAWSVNVNQAAATDVSFSVALNGISVTNVDAWVTRDQLDGIALVTVAGSPTTLTLVNSTGSILTYDASTTVRANIVIMQIG
ncbi:MAG: hypothetical protein EOM69_00870 [Clostridia bacterium]|nr:hypothetical protein [Clostridia bacterium]